ncbi:MAG TPA: FAD-dependent oxidoreductase [Streptosporangiaceae bacterium]
MPADYDLIVIGGGAAGLGAARAGAAAGARTLLVSESEIGGECTFTGCVPSKTLIETAARRAAFSDAIAAVHPGGCLVQQPRGQVMGAGTGTGGPPFSSHGRAGQRPLEWRSR